MSYEQNTMAILLVLPCLFVLGITSVDPEDPISKLLGRVFIKNLKLQKYLFIDPLAMDVESKALLWNSPQALPPQGGAWFHLAKSPSKRQVDYNLVGGAKWNFTLCVSMTQPEGEVNLHNVLGHVDQNHMEVPECRWKIAMSFDEQNYWLINRLYGGHLTAGDAKFNVDPLRRRAFLAVRVEGEDDREKWQIGRVPEPNDRNGDEEYWQPGGCFDDEWVGDEWRSDEKDNDEH